MLCQSLRDSHYRATINKRRNSTSKTTPAKVEITSANHKHRSEPDPVAFRVVSLEMQILANSLFSVSPGASSSLYLQDAAAPTSLRRLVTQILVLERGAG